MLFEAKRVCCVCSAGATANQKQLVAGEPNILAISLTIYRRGAGKGQSARALRVRICEPCLIRAMAGSFFGPGREGSKLWVELRSAISHRYESMLEEDQEDHQDGRVGAANLSPGVGSTGAAAPRVLHDDDLFAAPSLFAIAGGE